MRRVGFDQSYRFIYSPRPGTPASSLPDPVPREVKQHRLERLQALLNEQAAAISRAMVGTVQRVLVETTFTKSARELSGRTENNRWVHFIGEPDLVADFVDVLDYGTATQFIEGPAQLQYDAQIRCLIPRSYEHTLSVSLLPRRSAPTREPGGSVRRALAADRATTRYPHQQPRQPFRARGPRRRHDRGRRVIEDLFELSARDDWTRSACTSRWRSTRGTTAVARGRRCP